MLKKLKGQSTLEYALIIAVVVGALLAMQFYMNRGVQGKLRAAADEVGPQYSAGNTTYKYTTEQKAPMETRETFGKELGKGEGISRYEVKTAASTTRSALGDDQEKITKKLSEEELFPVTP